MPDVSIRAVVCASSYPEAISDEAAPQAVLREPIHADFKGEPRYSISDRAVDISLKRQFRIMVQERLHL